MGFIFFAPLGPGLTLCFIIVSIYLIFFKGRKRRRKRTSSRPSSKKEDLFPEGMIVHRNYNKTRPEFRIEAKEYMAEKGYFPSGNYFCSNNGTKEVYVNTVMEFIGYTIFLGMVYDYASLSDGSTFPDPLDLTIDTADIETLVVYKSGNGYYMKFSMRGSDTPKELLFEFTGPSAMQYAENAKKLIFNKIEERNQLYPNKEF